MESSSNWFLPVIGTFVERCTVGRTTLAVLTGLGAEESNSTHKRNTCSQDTLKLTLPALTSKHTHTPLSSITIKVLLNSLQILSVLA